MRKSSGKQGWKKRLSAALAAAVLLTSLQLQGITYAAEQSPDETGQAVQYTEDVQTEQESITSDETAEEVTPTEDTEQVQSAVEELQAGQQNAVQEKGQEEGQPEEVQTEESAETKEPPKAQTAGQQEQDSAQEEPVKQESTQKELARQGSAQPEDIQEIDNSKEATSDGSVLPQETETSGEAGSAGQPGTSENGTEETTEQSGEAPATILLSELELSQSREAGKYLVSLYANESNVKLGEIQAGSGAFTDKADSPVYIGNLAGYEGRTYVRAAFIEKKDGQELEYEITGLYCYPVNGTDTWYYTLPGAASGTKSGADDIAKDAIIGYQLPAGAEVRAYYKIGQGKDYNITSNYSVKDEASLWNVNIKGTEKATATAKPKEKVSVTFQVPVKYKSGKMTVKKGNTAIKSFDTTSTDGETFICLDQEKRTYQAIFDMEAGNITLYFEGKTYDTQKKTITFGLMYPHLKYTGMKGGFTFQTTKVNNRDWSGVNYAPKVIGTTNNTNGELTITEEKPHNGQVIENTYRSDVTGGMLGGGEDPPTRIGTKVAAGECVAGDKIEFTLSEKLYSPTQNTAVGSDPGFMSLPAKLFVDTYRGSETWVKNKNFVSEGLDFPTGTLNAEISEQLSTGMKVTIKCTKWSRFNADNHVVPGEEFVEAEYKITVENIAYDFKLVVNNTYSSQENFVIQLGDGIKLGEGPENGVSGADIGNLKQFTGSVVEYGPTAGINGWYYPLKAKTQVFQGKQAISAQPPPAIDNLWKEGYRGYLRVFIETEKYYSRPIITKTGEKDYRDENADAWQYIYQKDDLGKTDCGKYGYAIGTTGRVDNGRRPTIFTFSAEPVEYQFQYKNSIDFSVSFYNYHEPSIYPCLSGFGGFFLLAGLPWNWS